LAEKADDLQALAVAHNAIGILTRRTAVLDQPNITSSKALISLKLDDASVQVAA
jgi:hypothetical protein